MPAARRSSWSSASGPTSCSSAVLPDAPGSRSAASARGRAGPLVGPRRAGDRARRARRRSGRPRARVRARLRRLRSAPVPLRGARRADPRRAAPDPAGGARAPGGGSRSRSTGDAARDGRRPARRARGEGVRAAGRSSRREPTRVFTKEELLREVWGFRSLGRTRTLDSHASRAAAEARSRGRRRLRRERLGRRLPAARRVRGGAAHGVERSGYARGMEEIVRVTTVAGASPRPRPSADCCARTASSATTG